MRVLHCGKQREKVEDGKGKSVGAALVRTLRGVYKLFNLEKLERQETRLVCQATDVTK